MGAVKNSMMVLEEIGRENGLFGEQLNRYVQYIWTRWSEKIERTYEASYLKEWAVRFRRGTEYAYSDLTGQKVLDIIDSVSYVNAI